MKKKSPKIISTLLILLLIFEANAQKRQQPKIGIISASVVDENLKQPVEYATIGVFKKKDSSLVSGGVTNEKGNVLLTELQLGLYDIEVSFIGYEKTVVRNIRLTRQQPEVNLGKVVIKEAAESLDEIEVVGNKSAIEYKIDKKVINIDQFDATAGGSVVDILENIPSVSVDIEGNVSLRGSSGFTVLIDGKPTILEPSDVLNQLPADAVENIEIITNPSAKYDPDGTAGIINIITKKSKLKGFTGMITLNSGLNQKNYGGDLLVNYRNAKFNAFIGINYRDRFAPGKTETRRETYSNDSIYHLNSKGESDFNRENYNFKAGMEFFLSPKDNLTIEANLGGWNMSETKLLNYEQWVNNQLFFQNYSSLESWDLNGQWIATNFNYIKKFKNDNHSLTAQVNLSQRNIDEKSTNELRNNANIITNAQESTDVGPGRKLRMRLDYSLPLSNDRKIELGYQGRVSLSQDKNELRFFNTETKNFVLQPLFSNDINYNRSIHSLYGIYSGTLSKLGYQFGLRGEYTYRDITLLNSPTSFSFSRLNIFPTFHFSYKLSKTDQLMISYTRRIERSRGWFLEPFITWSDAFNVRQGNPDLLPEFIDAYEAAYQKRIGSVFISLEGYHRVNHNAVQRVQSLYTQDLILHSFANIGKDISTGSELMINFDVKKWWEISTSGNLYNYVIKGQLFDENINNQSLNWSTRINNTFKLSKASRLQLSGNYNSATASAQGEREGFVVLNAGGRYEFLKGKLTATMQIRDILGSRKEVSTTTGEGFNLYNFNTRQFRVVTASLSYKINNYKEKRKGQNNNDQGDF